MDHALSRLGELFGTHGFDKSLAGMKLVSAKDGEAVVRLEVTDAVTNWVGTLHGGAIATLVDDAGTCAIISKDRDHRPGVTTDLNVSYLNPGPGGTFVLAKAKVLKAGKTLAYVSVDIVREHDGVVVAQGRMTKFMG
jgi:acyl-coenzyme A thioesterase 13